MTKNTNNKQIFVERETFEKDGRTFFSYFIKGNIRGKDVKVAVVPPDRGGYTVLDIVFGDQMAAQLVAKPFEIKDDATGKIIAGNTYSVQTVDENGVIDEKKQLLKYIRYTNSLCPSAEEGELIIVLDLSAADITVIGDSAFDAFLNIAIGYNALGIGTSFTEEVAIIDTATGGVLDTVETTLTNSSVWDNFSVRIILPPPREGGEIYFADNSLNTQWYSPNAVELDITDSELRKNADGSISGIRLSPQATGTNIWGTTIQPLHLHWITAEDDLTQQEYAFKNGVDFILAGGAGSTAEYDADAEMYVKKGNNGLAVHRSEISRTAGGNSQKSITIYAAENPQTGYADHTDVINLFNYLYVNYVTQGFSNMFEETKFYHVLLNEDNTPSSAAGTVTVDKTLDIYCSHRTGGEVIGSITAA